MMVLILRMKVRPGNRDELLQVIRRMLEPTRVEQGCLGFRFYQDIEDRNAYTFIEEYGIESSRESLTSLQEAKPARRLFNH